MKRVTGFTLLELIVSMAIIAILAAVGVPSFLGTMESKRVQSPTEELYQRLYAARSQAINQQKTVYISFNPGTNWCFGMDTTGYCNCTNPSSCNIGTTSNQNNGVNLSVSGFSSNQTQIQAGRGIFSQSGNITFSLNGKSATVEAAIMGRLRICSSTVGGLKPC